MHFKEFVQENGFQPPPRASFNAVQYTKHEMAKLIIKFAVFGLKSNTESSKSYHYIQRKQRFSVVYGHNHRSTFLRKWRWSERNWEWRSLLCHDTGIFVAWNWSPEFRRHLFPTITMPHSKWNGRIEATIQWTIYLTPWTGKLVAQIVCYLTSWLFPLGQSKFNRLCG